MHCLELCVKIGFTRNTTVRCFYALSFYGSNLDSTKAIRAVQNNFGLTEGQGMHGLLLFTWTMWRLLSWWYSSRFPANTFVSSSCLTHRLLIIWTEMLSIFWTMIFYNLKNLSQDLSNEGSNFILSSLEVGHWVAQTYPFFCKLPEITDFCLLQQSQNRARFWICWVLT